MMQQILTTASILVPLVIALTGLIKTQIANHRFLPVINVVAGIFLGILYALSFAQTNIILYAWAGFVAGLAAGGLFDLGASIGQKDELLPDYGDGQSETEHTYHGMDQKEEE